MNKTVVAVAVVAGLLGFALTWFGVLPQLVKQVSPYTTPIVDTVKPVATAIYNGWISIPSPVRSILLAGIPTLFAIFFAWTKTRAMKKLQETQLQTQQVLGEKQQTLQHLGTLSQEKTVLAGELESVTKENELLKQYQVNADRLLAIQSNVTQMKKETNQTVESLRTEMANIYQQIKEVRAEAAAAKHLA